MSVVHLSSVGQRPENFFNQFPQGIHLPPNSEVAVMGYSGTLDDAQDTVRSFFEVVAGENDSMVVFHSQVALATNPNEQQMPPFVVKMPAGAYNNVTLATELQQELNQQENLHQYVFGTAGGAGGWMVTYNAVADTYRFDMGQQMNNDEDGGKWEKYGGVGNGEIVNTIAGTIINPYGAVAPPTTFVSGLPGVYINTMESFKGDNGQPSTVPAGATGYTMKMSIAAGLTQYTDLQVTHGIATQASATLYRPTGYKEIVPWLFGARPQIEAIPGAVASGETDLAYPHSPYGWCAMGMTVGLDGRIGVITSASISEGSVKQAGNQTIEWFSGAGQVITPAHLAAGCAPTMCMSPRYRIDHYVMDFFFDDNVTAPGTYVFLTSKSVGSYEAGDKYALLQNDTLHHVVHYNQKYFNEESVFVTVSTSNKRGNVAAVAPVTLTPREPMTLGYLPMPQLQFAPGGILEKDFRNMSNQYCNKLSQQLGFIFDYETFPIPGAGNGFRFTTADDLADVVADRLYPVIITCPSLPIRGYIGSGGGGGQEAPVLGVVRLRSVATGNVFSGLCTPMWIKLNNSGELRLDRLNIVLVDELNKEIDILGPNFSCWLQFRCPHKPIALAEKSVGNSGMSVY